MSKIQVLLVNEIRLMGNVIAASLEDEADIAIVSCVTNSEEAIQIIREEKVDIALISTRLPEQGALNLTREISSIAPATKVLILGLTENKERVLQYVEAGASGYVLKDHSMEDLLETIRAARSGEAHVSPEIAAAMMARISELAQLFAGLENSTASSAGLTPREIEVLELIGAGLTNQEIADHLVIEIGTVKNHVHNILDKLNVSSRGEAAAYLTFIQK